MDEQIRMAWINEYGDIEKDPDPYKELPPRVSKALEEFLLVSDYELATYRMDALDSLIMNEWIIGVGSDEDEEATSAWARRYEGKDFVVVVDEDGELASLPPGQQSPEPHATIPQQLLGLLIRDVLTQPLMERVARCDSISDLEGEWREYYIDEEKLLGHLVKAHALGVDLREEGHDALISRHADLHRTLRAA